MDENLRSSVEEVLSSTAVDFNLQLSCTVAVFEVSVLPVNFSHLLLRQMLLNKSFSCMLVKVKSV